MDTKPPIINCHSHIFTGDHVPPWLARTFLPWPFYFLLPVSLVVAFLRWWFKEKGPNEFFYGPVYKRIVGALYKTRMFVARNFVLNILSILLGVFVTLNVFFFFYHIISCIPGVSTKDGGWISRAEGFLKKFTHDQCETQYCVDAFIYAAAAVVFLNGEGTLSFLSLKQLWKFMGMLPGRKTIDLVKRYVLIGRFSRYKGQGGLFRKLKGQYPKVQDLWSCRWI